MKSFRIGKKRNEITSGKSSDRSAAGKSGESAKNSQRSSA